MPGLQGLQGPAGLTWRGAYNPTTTYVASDAVTSGGSAYVCRGTGCSGVTPRPTGTDWSLLAQAGKASLNPKRVAMLRWWDANTGLPSVTPAAGPARAVAFDGRYLYTATDYQQIEKLDPWDGSSLLRHGAPSLPSAIAADEASIWVGGNGSVVRYKPADLSVLTTTPHAAGVLSAMAYDGEFMWLAGASGAVARFSADGTLVNTLNLPTGCVPKGMAFDGASMWVACSALGTVARFDTAAASYVDAYPVGQTPVGVAFDGANLWVAANGEGQVHKLDPATGANLGAYPVAAPSWLAFDGADLWVTSGTSSLVRLRREDGTVLRTVAVDPNPTGIAFDGVKLWLAAGVLTRR